MNEHHVNTSVSASASASASASSSSSLNSSFQETEDDEVISRILAEDESSLRNDGKLGKRLSHLDSIPHTPRVNGQIPDVSDATLDHERLSQRLATYGLAELQMEGDCNCQFRALADQLFRNPDYHKHVRKGIIKQLKHFRKSYEGYVPMKYRTYLKKMKKSGIWVMLFFSWELIAYFFIIVWFVIYSLFKFFFVSRLGEWGDHITLQGAADHFGVKICLVTSFRDTCYIEILPKDKNPSRELWLSFWSEVHYNSLYGVGDVPTRAPKKKHWLF